MLRRRDGAIAGGGLVEPGDFAFEAARRTVVVRELAEERPEVGVVLVARPRRERGVVADDAGDVERDEVAGPFRADCCDDAPDAIVDGVRPLLRRGDGEEDAREGRPLA